VERPSRESVEVNAGIPQSARTDHGRFGDGPFGDGDRRSAQRAAAFRLAGIGPKG
jgi:hypothetical protein